MSTEDEVQRLNEAVKDLALAVAVLGEAVLLSNKGRGLPRKVEESVRDATAAIAHLSS
jgi:uncharacterized membrane protein